MSTKAPALFVGHGSPMILLEPSHVADLRMRIFNEDGSEVQSCGNASRSMIAMLARAAAWPADSITNWPTQSVDPPPVVFKSYLFLPLMVQ